MLAASTERVSVKSNEAQANDLSEWPSVSDDGRFVAFTSLATNLVAGDTNGFADIFVRDRLTGATQRVSVSSAGVQADWYSTEPSISADGRYVAFTSRAGNLVADHTNTLDDVFVHDRATGGTEIVSVSGTGAQGDNRSVQPSISADGRYVAFLSSASNLVPGDTNFHFDAFVKDRLTGNIERVGVASDGAQIAVAIGPRISGDGRFVVFIAGSGVVPGDTNGVADVFVRDRIALTTTRVSVSSTGAEANGASLYNLPNLVGYTAINRDGRFVAFAAEATNLVAGDTNGAADIFVRDRLTGTTERVSVNSAEAQSTGGNIISFPSISADGRFVVFDNFGPDLVPGDTNAVGDVFVRDRRAGTTSRVSVSSAGAEANNHSFSYDVSGDGRYVAFHSTATNLVAGDSNGQQDIFLRDRGPPEPPRNDLLVDFGTRGLFQRLNNAGPFAQVHTKSPIAITAGDLDGSGQDEAIASFKNGGLRARFDNGGHWRVLHATGPTRIVAGDFDGDGRDDLAGDFAGLGLLVRINNGAWVERHGAATQGLAVGDLDRNGKDELIIDRGRRGIWARYNNGGGWVRLDARNPLRMITADLDGNGRDEVVADRPGGLFVRYNNADRWQRLHAAPSAGLAAGDLDGGGRDDLLVDAGASGLWVLYNNGQVGQQLHTASPFDIVTADLDQSGKSEAIIDRGGRGVWARYNNAGPWRRLTPWRSEAIAAAGFD